MKKLSRQECEEIYYALSTKQLRLESAYYHFSGEPPEVADEDIKPWIKDLKAILKKIGPDGKTLYASQK
jgi:hypothetical protein